MEKAVLLVVDVQNCIVDENLYNEKRVISNIQSLLSEARASGLEVIYVRHNDGEGSDMEYGSDGWQIYAAIAPMEGERIFDKQYNSAFLKTGLEEYLKELKAKTIILVGLQTEYCIDATCKAAFEHGFQLIIPEETNSTFDNEYLSGERLYHYYNYKIWNNRFAKVLPTPEVIASIGTIYKV
ncbi:MAG: nicotinamidase-like amidase [Herbinix sp.]|jgi:nicotinamidase-related amidase|nr:nicotinamidase-like amidase [Herbinix sp.]